MPGISISKDNHSTFVVSILLSFVIIFGLAYIIAYKSYTKAIDATIHSNETRAFLLSKLILEHQRAAIGVLQSYAHRPLLVDSVKKRDFEGTLKHLIDLAKHNPEMDWPFISNPDSTVWVNYPVDRQSMNKDLSHRDWYKGVSREWKPYISNVYKLIVGEKDLAVAVSVPIFDEKGKAIGILSTAQSAAFFHKIIGEIGLNLDVKITLIDQEGHIIYSNRFPYTKEFINYSPLEFIGKALKGEKGNVKVRDVSDRDRIKYVSFAPIEGIGWSIIVEKTKSEVLRSETSYLILIGIISLLLYGLVVLSLVHLRGRHKQIEETERKRAEKELQQSEARFRLLSGTAGRLLAADDPQRVVEELCRDVMKHLDCHTFFNFLVDESAGRLRLNAYAGIPDEEAQNIEWLDYGVAVCGCVARERARIIAEDIFHIPDPRTDLVKSYGIQAYCCHPLMVQSRLIGTLSFGTKTRPHFTPEEVDLMRTVTDQVAIAMQRIQTQRALRQHAQELQNLNETLEQRVKERTAELAALTSQFVSAQENERKRVSYDLHDNVWQTLLAIRLEIERLFSGREGGDWAALRSKSERLKESMLNAVGKIRSMQGDLWPYVLDDIGLLATIDWYCREFEKTHSGLAIKIKNELTESEISSSAKIVIYRILQETLSNIVEHSQARQVMIRLMKKDREMELTVQDNGIGFDPEEKIVRKAPLGGLGLLSIKARTELSGGSFGVESVKGKGTTVRASWPL